MELQDKGVLVTGGASGLGAACVRLLAGNGAKVVIADLNSEAGETLATQLRENGSHVSFIQADVASEVSMQAAVQAVVQHSGHLHILINCAGIGVAEKVFG